MSNSFTRILFLLIMFLSPLVSQGQDVYDSAYIRRVQDTVDRYIRRHPELRYPKSGTKKFSLIPVYGAMYSPEQKLMAMGGFMGSFRTSGDTLVPLSQVGAIASVSTNLHIAGALAGSVFSGNGGFLFTWSAKFNNSPGRFWGLGYENAASGKDPGSMTERRLRIRTDYLYRHSGSFMAGVMLGYNFYKVAELSAPELLEGQPLAADYLYAGLRLDVDTRDDMFSPTEGLYINLEQGFWFPTVMDSWFSKTSFIADFYFSGWEGAVFAVDMTGEFNSAAAPWMFWPEVGGDERMRGYYLGKYRERNFIAAQLELRQKIYKWHGIALWGGAGNVFGSSKEFRIKNTLPTYGAGYRFSFYSLVFRLDFAFGNNGQWAVLAGFNHSF